MQISVVLCIHHKLKLSAITPREDAHIGYRRYWHFLMLLGNNMNFIILFTNLQLLFFRLPSRLFLTTISLMHMFCTINLSLVSGEILQLVIFN